MNKYQKEMARHAKKYIEITKEYYGENNNFRSVRQAVKLRDGGQNQGTVEYTKALNKEFESFLINRALKWKGWI